MIAGNDTDDNINTSSCSRVVNSNKKRRKKKETVMSEFENDYDEIKNEASGIISSLSSNDAIIPLTLSISSYLMPRDVLHCIQTCKLWNDKFNKSAVWCEVAKAVSSPFAIGAIREAANVNEDANLSYRKIAIALTQPKTELEELEGDEEQPQPKLRLEDFLLVMEIRNSATNQNIATCCKDFSDFDDFSPDYCRALSFTPAFKDSKQERFTNIVLPANQLPSSCDDDDDVIDYCVFEFLEITMRLIRCDNGTSVSFSDYTSRAKPFVHQGSCWFEVYTIKPTASNPSGTVAREICFENQYSYAEIEPEVALEKLSKYEYRIKRCEFCLRVQLSSDVDNDDSANGNFKSTNHLLLFMEGLNWK